MKATLPGFGDQWLIGEHRLLMAQQGGCATRVGLKYQKRPAPRRSTISMLGKRTARSPGNGSAPPAPRTAMTLREERFRIAEGAAARVPDPTRCSESPAISRSGSNFPRDRPAGHPNLLRRRACGIEPYPSPQASGTLSRFVSSLHIAPPGAVTRPPHSGPSAWARSRLLPRPLRPSRRVDDANDPLAPRIEMDVLHLYRLAVL